MISVPMDVLSNYPVRKSKKQKLAFRQDVRTYLEGLGYQVTEEKGSFGARNMVIGDPEKAKYLITAHYDTPAGMLFPNLITPCNFWPFIAYQVFMTGAIFLGAFVLVILLALLGLPAEIASGAWSLFLYLILGLMLYGPANPSNANDNTSGVVTVLETARSFPETQRHKVCFVLFDLEEAGLLGSAAYRKKHKKASQEQLIINLDCVGDGDHILIFPTKKLKKEKSRIAPIYKCCGYFGKKSLLVRDKGFSVYPSDQKNFPYGVGICALRDSKFGLYLGRIHTKKDTVLEETNVNILRAAIISMIACEAE